MIDLERLQAISKAELVRAFCVEKTLENAPLGTDGATIVNVSKMIEDFITNGDTSGTITTAVEEGYREGRFEVKEAVEEWFSNVDLKDLFVTKGWMRNLPEPGTVREY
jgi:hypothetical protein